MSSNCVELNNPTILRETSSKMLSTTVRLAHLCRSEQHLLDVRCNDRGHKKWVHLQQLCNRCMGPFQSCLWSMYTAYRNQALP